MSERVEFCACTVYPPGYECDMVICWRCEHTVGVTDEFGAMTVRHLQGGVPTEVCDEPGCGRTAGLWWTARSGRPRAACAHHAPPASVVAGLAADPEASPASTVTRGEGV